ncbi:UDP-N-acetylglucosamine 2-epimerase family protein [Francisella philomiragia]|uniref:hypothetical protein n=1 Tax=Francisella philomiragia TaxID=28110 RepID=UPI0005A576CD|nr:hypothetical protein [Francisella philomiragia]AJI56765.1 UDP-N-acetylglucosamine 2-epimerase family protein [Francisella philomiragia]
MNIKAISKKIVNKCTFGLISQIKLNKSYIENHNQLIQSNTTKINTLEVRQLYIESLEKKLETFEKKLETFEKKLETFEKKIVSLEMKQRHQELLKTIKNKQKIKVVFLAIHKSVWKVDNVFKKMLDDPYFEPLILVCPYTVYGEDRMWEDMEDTYKYFEEKGYPLLSSYNKEEDRWLSLEEIMPDIVFFMNPHGLTKKEYYEDAYLNYLSCYAGYGMHTAHFNSGQSQYNQLFHNAVWKIFVQNNNMYKEYLKHSRDKYNLHLIIDNIVEEIVSINKETKKAWKNPETHKKIIFAPHHSIFNDGILNLGNFLKFAEMLKQQVLKSKETITWSFKPHPILKQKLYLYSEWGKEKTDEYYSFWNTQINSQLDEGEYIELFKQSDAIIHDSASFIAEYIFTNKPMLYLMNDNTRSNLNAFGNNCLNTATEAWNEEDIKTFIDNLFKNIDNKKDDRNNFIEEYFRNLGENKKSSDIVKIIKKSIEEA